jgi:hypothetical protein
MTATEKKALCDDDDCCFPSLLKQRKSGKQDIASAQPLIMALLSS